LKRNPDIQKLVPPYSENIGKSILLYSYKGALGIRFSIIKQSKNEDIEEKNALNHAIVLVRNIVINLAAML